jgi:hypothetical protein
MERDEEVLTPVIAGLSFLEEFVDEPGSSTLLFLQAIQI